MKTKKHTKDKWFWKMSYCKNNRLTPATEENWKKAEEAYIKYLRRKIYTLKELRDNAIGFAQDEVPIEETAVYRRNFSTYDFWAFVAYWAQERINIGEKPDFNDIGKIVSIANNSDILLRNISTYVTKLINEKIKYSEACKEIIKAADQNKTIPPSENMNSIW